MAHMWYEMEKLSLLVLFWTFSMFMERLFQVYEWSLRGYITLYGALYGLYKNVYSANKRLKER